MKRLLISLVMMLLGPVATRAEVLATPWLDFREARIRLLADTGAPQGQLVAGLEIELAEGFKTYWRNAGDSGVPPMFDFSGSAHLSGLAVAFPFPGRFDDGAGGMAWGYKHSVVLPISGTAGQKDYRLALALDFAVCGTMCIPLNGKLELTPATGVVLTGEEAGRLAAARARLPVADEAYAAKILRPEAGKPKWRVTLSYSGEVAAITAFAEGKGFLDVVAIEPGGKDEVLLTISGQPEPGSGDKFGPVRLTFGTPEKSFEKTLDLDGAPSP